METKAALQKLREHCRQSPKGAILNTIGKLQEPKRCEVGGMKLGRCNGDVLIVMVREYFSGSVVWGQ